MFLKNGPVVVVQLVERSLPIPDVHGSNLAIVKNLNIEHLFTVNCIEKTKIKEKEAGNGPFLKTLVILNITIKISRNKFRFV